MAEQGCEDGLYDSCTDFYDAALKTAEEEDKQGVDLTHLFHYKPDPTYLKKILKQSIKIHDHTLDHLGQRTAVHRTHSVPFDEKLRKKKKYGKKRRNQAKDIIIVGRQNYFRNNRKAEEDDNYKANMTNIIQRQRDILCRGKEIRVR